MFLLSAKLAGFVGQIGNFIVSQGRANPPLGHAKRQTGRLTENSDSLSPASDHLNWHRSSENERSNRPNP